MVDFVILNQGEDVRKPLCGDITLNLSVWVPLSDCLEDVILSGGIVKVLRGEETNELLSVNFIGVVVDPVSSVGVKDVVHEVVFAEVEHVLNKSPKLAFSEEVGIVSP